MWLSEDEIKQLPPHPKYGRPTKVHLSLGPGADGNQKTVLDEHRRLTHEISLGKATVIKSMDKGTISFRATYRSLRDLGWGRVKSFSVSAYRKVVNVFRVGRL